MAEKESLLYGITRTVVTSFFETAYQQEVYGRENLPQEGAFILAANHGSMFDPPLIGNPVPRPIYFFARRTLLENKVAAWLYPRLNAIPVDREGADVRALKNVLQVLKQGSGILVFPEGTRTPDGSLLPGKAGIGLIACRAGVPVIPTRVYGSYEAWGRHRKLPTLQPTMTIIYGKPLLPEDYDPGKQVEDRYAQAAQKIMDAIGSIELPVTKID